MKETRLGINLLGEKPLALVVTESERTLVWLLLLLLLLLLLYRGLGEDLGKGEELCTEKGKHLAAVEGLDSKGSSEEVVLTVADLDIS